MSRSLVDPEEAPTIYCFPPGTLDKLYTPGIIQTTESTEVPSAIRAFSIEEIEADDSLDSSEDEPPQRRTD